MGKMGILGMMRLGVGTILSSAQRRWNRRSCGSWSGRRISNCMRFWGRNMSVGCVSLRIGADEAADFVVVSCYEQDDVPSIQKEEDAKFEADAEFEKVAEAADAEAGVSVRVSKTFGQASDGCSDFGLLRRC